MNAKRVYIAVAACAVVVHIGALWNGFAMDDLYIIVWNPLVHSAEGIWRGFVAPYWPPDLGGKLYRPLAVASYTLDGLVDDAPWFHAVNLIWHAGAAVAVTALARRWAGMTTALVAGLIFAVHPVHVEAIANVIGRAELMAAVGACLAVYAAVVKESIGWSALALAAGLLSKENAAVAPGLILWAWAVGLARPPRARMLAFVGSWLAIAAVYVALRGGGAAAVRPPARRRPGVRGAEPRRRAAHGCGDACRRASLTRVPAHAPRRLFAGRTDYCDLRARRPFPPRPRRPGAVGGAPSCRVATRTQGRGVRARLDRDRIPARRQLALSGGDSAGRADPISAVGGIGFGGGGIGGTPSAGAPLGGRGCPGARGRRPVRAPGSGVARRCSRHFEHSRGLAQFVSRAGAEGGSRPESGGGGAGARRVPHRQPHIRSRCVAVRGRRRRCLHPRPPRPRRLAAHARRADLLPLRGPVSHPGAGGAGARRLRRRGLTAAAGGGGAR